MSESLTYQSQGAPARDQVHTLFAQTMGYVAVTAAFAALIGRQFAARRSLQLTVGLLGLFGLLTGLAVAPTVAYYGSMDPRALWQAGGATGLFIAGFGAAIMVRNRIRVNAVSPGIIQAPTSQPGTPRRSARLARLRQQLPHHPLRHRPDRCASGRDRPRSPAWQSSSQRPRARRPAAGSLPRR